MRRGAIWTVANGKDYAGKPRPAVIVQDISFDTTDAITVCAFTSNEQVAPLFRIRIRPTELNGLHASSRLMVDEITTFPKTKLGNRIGQRDDVDFLQLNRAILAFLGLAASP